MHCSTVMLLISKVFVTDSICSQVEKIACGLDVVFQVISFSANGRIFYFSFFFVVVVVLLILAYSFSLMLKTSSLMGSSHPVIITHTAKYENN